MMDNSLFSTYQSRVEELLHKIKSGEIALPDLQRPFVWEDAKVRDLLDSMNKGFPVGYVMLWDFPDDYDAEPRSSVIGNHGTRRVGSLLIDGQQRLTALLSAMDGIVVKDKNYENRRIRISFNPIANADDGRQIGQFEVWTSATEMNPEWISDISALYKIAAEDPTKGVYEFCQTYCNRIDISRKKKGHAEMTTEERAVVNGNINKLLSLRNYSLPVVSINRMASEEDVAEIFVRVNSGGQKLMEKNFIETLLAVYDNEIHKKILTFCESSHQPKGKSAYNHIIKPEPSHLIRAAVAVGFNRARLKYAYMLMRGRDLQKGKITKETQTQNLKKFRDAIEKVTNLNNWHTFLNFFPAAGYINESLVTSDNAVIYSYALYLIGKFRFKVTAKKLQLAITRYIFAVTITSTYSGSPESKFEEQLAELNNCRTADDFITYLDNFITTRFTRSYFDITLPNELKTSSSKAPSWCAFIASQNVLGSQVWLGTSPISALLAIGSSGTKQAYDKHHIFPQNYLNKNGIDKKVDRNQVANYVFIDYQSNINISDKAPAEYVPEYRDLLGEKTFTESCKANAIPPDFENMTYADFLKARRKLMAKIIENAYKKLSGQNDL